MKKTMMTITLLVALPSMALADNTDLPNRVANLSEKKTPDLKKAMTDKESEVRARFASNTQSEMQKKKEPNTTETVLRLMDEVENLKTKVVVTKQNVLATQNPRPAKKIGSNTVYTYKEGEIYEVHAGVDRVTDIALQPGEELSNAPVTGDNVRWKVSVIKSGTAEGPVTHLIVKPIDAGIETNLILTTQRRVYHLRAIAGDFYMPAISWTYPEDEARALELQRVKENRSEGLSIVPENLSFSYSIKGDDYKWKPVRMFDDGNKTFIQMKPEIASAEAPALFVIEEDGEPQLVNYRVKGNYYIVDRLFERAELRVGPKMRVELVSDSFKPSFWERIF